MQIENIYDYVCKESKVEVKIDEISEADIIAEHVELNEAKQIDSKEGSEETENKTENRDLTVFKTPVRSKRKKEMTSPSPGICYYLNVIFRQDRDRHLLYAGSDPSLCFGRAAGEIKGKLSISCNFLGFIFH